MKKLLAILLTLVLSLCAFGAFAEDLDAIPDEVSADDGVYAVAFVTDVGQLKDKSFNQGTWNGVKSYASANGLTYKYYQPANGDQATDEDRVDAMNAAVDNGAQIVVCAGFMQEGALTTVAAANPDVAFVFIDGYPVADADGNLLTNVAPIAFKEEQSGYFAGYAVVMDGFTKLGFSGGGGGTNPACIRYGYGFVQGAEAAAAELGLDEGAIDIRYSWQNGGSFSASPELQTQISGWYETGTEIVFACGGSMFSSIVAAASANDGYVVGVDVDQHPESDTVVTSAMKGLTAGTEWAIAKFYDGTFDEIGGTPTSLGVDNDAVGLPTDAESWLFETFTVEQYEASLAAVKAGDIVVDDTVYEQGAVADLDLAHVNVLYE